jgi:hypothetical protein
MSENKLKQDQELTGAIEETIRTLEWLRMCPFIRGYLKARKEEIAGIEKVFFDYLNDIADSSAVAD